jgi:hypothetical protein
MSFRWWAKLDRSSRTRPSWRPTPKWVSAGCAEAAAYSGNRKVWISGALNFGTGSFHWVTGERKNDELFTNLLEQLRRTLRCYGQLHLATDNDGIYTSKWTRRYLEDRRGRIHLRPRCPHGAPRATLWS